jgi:hypothetical protein
MIAHIRTKGADDLAQQAEQRVTVEKPVGHRRGAVSRRPTGLGQQQLDHQRGDHSADQLDQPVDGGVEQRDPAQGEEPEGHGRVEVGARRAAQRVDQHGQDEGVHQSDDGVVRRADAVGRADDDDRGDEEDEQEGADELGGVGGRSAFFHGRSPWSGGRGRAILGGATASS